MGYPEAEYTISEILSSLPGNMGSGIPPINVNFNFSTDNLFFYLTWTPKNTLIGTKTVCVSGGVIFVIKPDSPPVNRFDGVAILEYSGEEYWKHSVESVKTAEGMDAGKTFYCRAFTYSDQGVFNYEENIKSCVTNDEWTMTYSQNMADYNPSSTISYSGTNKDFSAAMTNTTVGTLTLGTWSIWSWLQKVKPFMVLKNGKADYQLDPNDLTKKADGTPSDITNTSYNGGAFVWIPLIYEKETFNGNTRTVSFSNTKNGGGIPHAFLVPKSGSTYFVTEGIWLPIFYLSKVGDNYKTIGGTTPISGVSPSSVIEGLEAQYPGHSMLGGALMNLLRDIEYMIFKTTDIQSKAGYGRGRYEEETLLPINYVILDEGAFYGSGQLARKLNKMFYSNVLGSYISEIFDPYLASVNNAVVYHPAHSLSDVLSHDGFISVAGATYTNPNVIFPVKLTAMLNNSKNILGSMPTSDNLGSNSTGLCDAYYGKANSTTTPYHFNRLGGSVENLSGPGYFSIKHAMNETITDNSITYAQVLVPPLGYSPYSTDIIRNDEFTI